MVLRKDQTQGPVLSAIFLRPGASVPKPRVALRMIKDIIRLKWEGKLPHEQIAAALAVSKGVVTKYVGLAAAAGLDWETVREWDERALVSRLLPRSERWLRLFRQEKGWR